MSSDNNSTLKKNYTSEYYSYHRNTVVMFLLTIMTLVPGLKLKIDGLGPIKSIPEFVEQAIPFVFWLSGIYHWVLFHAEWKECAEPHRTQLDDALSKVNTELSAMSDGYRSISDNLDTSIRLLKDMTSPLILSSINHKIRDTVSEQLGERIIIAQQYYQSVKKNYEQRMTGFTQEAQNHVLIVRNCIKNKMDQMDEEVDQKILELEYFMRSSFDEYEGVISDFGEFVMNDARNNAAKYEDLSDITKIELQQSHQSVGQIVNLANEIAQTVEFYKSKVDNLGDLVLHLRNFSDKKRVFVRAKTDFSGIYLPFLLCFIASVGIFSHYIFKIQQFLLAS